MDVEALKAEVNEIPWWHRIDLGHGIVTPGRDDSPTKLKSVHMPDDLSGMSVLDIGAWDGFFSFEAERRGASRVLATDSFAWEGGLGGSMEGFLLAHRALESKVEYRKIDAMDLDPAEIGTFDLVLFLGVLYHMRHPLLALERVASVTADRLILETHVDMLRARRPAMAFYPGNTLMDDETNWWGPNPACVEGMLDAVGFGRTEVVAGRRLPSMAYRAARALRCRVTNGYWGYGPLGTALRSGRMTFHAWKQA